MGDRSHEPATDDDVASMCRTLGESLAAGGLGFSSSQAPTHNDGDGHPVPSRAATPQELLALAGAVGDHEGTTLEFIPTVGLFEDEHVELMTAMSLAGNRPLNWNVLAISSQRPDDYKHQLAAGDHAAERGAKAVALTVPDALQPRLTVLSR